MKIPYNFSLPDDYGFQSKAKLTGINYIIVKRKLKENKTKQKSQNNFKY